MAKKNMAPANAGQLDMLEALGQTKSVNYTEEQEGFIHHNGQRF